jgi:hypothetical protein
MPMMLRLVVALCCCGLLLATEKSTIVRNAGVIVVGKLEIASSFPASDGWHLKGKIVARDVLWGPARVGDHLDYTFDCIRCRPGIGSELRDYTSRAGIWFLVRRGETSWTSAGEPTDPGIRPLDERSYVVGILSKSRR